MPTYIVLLGPPGAGKGTQAEAITTKLSLPHISSGDIFRENLKKQTELGKLAAGYMNRGELVPDDVTIKMIQERLSRPDCKGGRPSGWVSSHACPGRCPGCHAG